MDLLRGSATSSKADKNTGDRKDEKPGDVRGRNTGDKWFVIKPEARCGDLRGGGFQSLTSPTFAPDRVNPARRQSTWALTACTCG